METINHECYVSLEVAKLLKQAGFDWEVNHRWQNWSNYADTTPFFLNALDYYEDSNDDVSDDAFSAPTIDVAQRWLREVKGICLTIQPLFDKVNGQFNVVVGFTPFIHRMDGEMIIVSLDSKHTYEEAQEAGIKKALEIILEKGE